MEDKFYFVFRERYKTKRMQNKNTKEKIQKKDFCFLDETKISTFVFEIEQKSLNFVYEIKLE